MKIYKTLDCPSLKQIQKEAKTWIKQETELLTDPPSHWNKIDTKYFIMLNPALSLYCTKTLKLILKEVEVIIADKGDVPLHTDDDEHVARINFPIQNTKDTFTEWYDGERKIEQVEMTKPMVVNSSIPHRVTCGPDAKTPGIVISCAFYKEPIEPLREETKDKK